MAKLKLYEVKVVIFIHDVVPLMFAGNYYLMDSTINYYNKADVVVAPSQKMLDILLEHGLQVFKNNCSRDVGSSDTGTRITGNL
ncbi:hypothetical protein ACR31S_00105 [Streptococcus iniae]